MGAVGTTADQAASTARSEVIRLVTTNCVRTCIVQCISLCPNEGGYSDARPCTYDIGCLDHCGEKSNFPLASSEARKRTASRQPRLASFGAVTLTTRRRQIQNTTRKDGPMLRVSFRVWNSRKDIKIEGTKYKAAIVWNAEKVKKCSNPLQVAVPRIGLAF